MQFIWDPTTIMSNDISVGEDDYNVWENQPANKIKTM